MKKEHPILFSTAMVQSILEGRKSQTRRIVKQPSNSYGFYISKNKEGLINGVYAYDEDERAVKPGTDQEWQIVCPYGKPGDVLWVRETLYQEGELGLYYVADDEQIDEEKIPEDYKPYRDYACCKVPNIHMQKSVARIWLEITNIKVERLHEISEDNAKAEGVEIVKVRNLSDPNDKIRYMDYAFADKYHPKARLWVTAKRSFESLWTKINGQDSWFSNPWVWVIEFKVLSKTGKP